MPHRAGLRSQPGLARARDGGHGRVGRRVTWARWASCILTAHFTACRGSEFMSRIETLIASMTLAEKLGQLTMTASSFTVTGPVIAGDRSEAIRSGAIGNLLNMVGAGPVRAMQRLAVEGARG